MTMREVILLFLISSSFVDAMDDAFCADSQGSPAGDAELRASLSEVRDALDESEQRNGAHAVVNDAAALVLDRLRTEFPSSRNPSREPCHVQLELNDFTSVDRNVISEPHSTSTPGAPSLPGAIFWRVQLRVRITRRSSDGADASSSENETYQAFVLETHATTEDSRALILLRLQRLDNARVVTIPREEVERSVSSAFRYPLNSYNSKQPPPARLHPEGSGPHVAEIGARRFPATPFPRAPVFQRPARALSTAADGVDTASFEIGSVVTCTDRTLADGSSWHDSRLYACADYLYHDWCDENGQYGSAWSQVWGTFENWSEEDRTAPFSCCGCGGGDTTVRKCGELNSAEEKLDVVVAAGDNGGSVSWTLVEGSGTGGKALLEGGSYAPGENDLRHMCLVLGQPYTLQLSSSGEAGWGEGHVSLWSMAQATDSDEQSKGCALLFEGALYSNGNRSYSVITNSTFVEVIVGAPERMTRVCGARQNAVSSDGGALYNSHAASVHLVDSVISFNEAVGGGGGIATQMFSSLSLDGCLMESNTVLSGYGGAISLSFSKFGMTRTRVVNNIAAVSEKRCPAELHRVPPDISLSMWAMLYEGRSADIAQEGLMAEIVMRQEGRGLRSVVRDAAGAEGNGLWRGTKEFTFVFSQSAECLQQEVPVQIAGDEVVLVSKNAYHAGLQLALTLPLASAIRLTVDVLLSADLPALGSQGHTEVTGACEASDGEDAGGSAATAHCDIDGVEQFSMFYLSTQSQALSLTLRKLRLLNPVRYAVWNLGGTLTMEHCGVYSFFSEAVAAVTVANGGTGIMADSIFDSNLNTGSSDAAVFSVMGTNSDGVGSSLLITRALVKRNSGKYAGIITCGIGGMVNVSESAFLDNIGGTPVMMVGTGTLDLSDVIVEGNVASQAYGIGSGGFVYTSGPDVAIRLRLCAVKSNRADLDGGMIYIAAEGTASLVTLEQCGLSNNTASRHGGALWMEAANATVRMNNVEVASGFAGFRGGAIMLEGPSAVIFMSHSRFEHNGALDSAGFIYIASYARAVAEHCSFRQNRVIGEGGGVALIMSGHMSFSDCFFQGNEAFMGGVASVVIGAMEMQHSLCTGNSADQSGGVFVTSGYASLKIHNTMLLENRALHGGAIRLEYGSNALLSHCHVLRNFADTTGGALYIVESQIAVQDSSLDENLGYISAGMLYMKNSEMALGGCQMTSNLAAITFGGVAFMEDSLLAIQNSKMRSNNGGALFGEYFQAVLEASVLVRNSAEKSGGAMLIKNGTVMLLEMLLEENNATDGGALALEVTSDDLPQSKMLAAPVIQLLGMGTNNFFGEIVSLPTDAQLSFQGTANISCTVSAVESLFSSNAAMLSGGAVLVHAHTMLEGRNCTFWGNTVHEVNGIGGAVAVHSGALGLSLDGSRLYRNQVADGLGGALFIEDDSVLPASLSRLEFANNSAMLTGGDSLYWVIQTTNTQPVAHLCEGCTGIEGRMATNPVHFSVLVNDSATGSTTRNLSGWYVDTAVLMVSSGEAIEGPLRYVARDFYGNAVSINLDLDILVALDENCSSIVGIFGGKEPYSHGIATFPLLTLTGPPTYQCHTLFIPSVEIERGWMSVEVVFQFAECHAGDVHDEGSDLCEPCEPGKLKFDATSAPCVACPEGLDCPGGNVFVVKQGYWVAPSAALCDVDDMSCFLDRVSECEVAEACESEGTRTATSPAEVTSLELCNAEEYSAGVLCSGSFVPVCASGYIRPSLVAECERCPPLHNALVTFCVWCCMFLVLIYGALWVCRKNILRGREEVLTSASDARIAMEICMAYLTGKRERIGSGDSFSAFRGGLFMRVLVLAQIVSIYDSKYLINAIGLASIHLGFLTFQVGTLTGVRCVLHHLVPHVAPQYNEFWANFCASCAQPFAIPLGFALVFQLESLWHRLCHRTQESHMARVHASYIFLTFFAMVLIHPSVGTMMCQIFRCESYYYTEAEKKLWLFMDTTTQCISHTWLLGSIASAVVLLVFVFGFPTALYLVMKNLRHWVKIRVSLADFKRREHMLATGLWWTQDGNGASLSYENLVELEHQCESGGGHAMVGDTVEVYVMRWSFIEVANDATMQNVPGLGKNRPKWLSRVFSGPVTRVLMLDRQKSKKVHPMEDSEGQENPLPWRMFMLDGSVMNVQLSSSNRRSDGIGRTTYLPITRLDDYEHILGQFYSPYKDEFYFWQCWEISRRLVQTSLILTVQLALGEKFAAVWALTVATLSIAVHHRCLPYESNALNELQLAMLVNVFIIQLSIVYMMMTEDQEDGLKEGITWFLVALQFTVLFFGVTLVIPAFKKQFLLLWETTNAVSLQVRRQVTLTNYATMRNMINIIREVKRAGTPDILKSSTSSVTAVDPFSTMDIPSNESSTMQSVLNGILRHSEHDTPPADVIRQSIREDGEEDIAEEPLVDSDRYSRMVIPGSMLPPQAGFIDKLQFNPPSEDVRESTSI
eukprot:gene5417-6569_t